MSNTRGLVIEMVRYMGDEPVAMRQAVLFPGIVLERETTKASKRKHWRSARYHKHEDGVLDVLNTGSWFGKWIENHARWGYVLLGKPYLMEANPAEMVEIGEGNMPRAMVLRLDKARTELGVRSPWEGE